MYVAKKDVQDAAGALQVRAGQNAGTEVAIHAMHDVFQEDSFKVDLLIDAENAFNSINREVILLNISIVCSIISTFISTCYSFKPFYYNKKTSVKNLVFPKL